MTSQVMHGLLGGALLVATGVTPNPSLELGPPPAWHLAREPVVHIIGLAGQAPFRLRPLSSNVRALMTEWTGIEIERARHGLEQASSTILGRMLFEFSRLDMALGLMLVWSNEGSQLERLTKLVAGYGFHKWLELLAELARTRYPMYVGMCFILLAWAVYLSAALPFLGPVVFVLYITRFQILPEELVLKRLFGEEYIQYTARVRHWL